ncbi:MAG: hypothetical protein ACI9PY_001458 [Ascidiaceihabitans sp.]
MAIETVYTLGASQVTVSNGGQLSGETQGSGVHLAGQTIVLNSNSWDAVTIDDTSNGSFADNQSSTQSFTAGQTMDGVTYTTARPVEAEYSFVVSDPAGNTYTLIAFNINQTGSSLPSYGSVEGLAFVGGVNGFPPTNVVLTVVSTAESPSFLYADLATPACFTAGSLIETDRGPVLIEELREGDLVQTQDQGLQPVLGVKRSYFATAALRTNIKIRPVLIKRGALGPNTPNRDMRLSPQHRVLVSGHKAELYFGSLEILVPICKLQNDSTIISDHQANDVTYFHILLGDHAIVFVDGLASESYFMNGADADTSTSGKEIQDIFAEKFRIFLPTRSTPILSDTSRRGLAFQTNAWRCCNPAIAICPTCPITSQNENRPRSFLRGPKSLTGEPVLSRLWFSELHQGYRPRMRRSLRNHTARLLLSLPRFHAL